MFDESAFIYLGLGELLRYVGLKSGATVNLLIFPQQLPYSASSFLTAQAIFLLRKQFPYTASSFLTTQTILLKQLK